MFLPLSSLQFPYREWIPAARAYVQPGGSVFRFLWRLILYTCLQSGMGFSSFLCWFVGFVEGMVWEAVP